MSEEKNFNSFFVKESIEKYRKGFNYIYANTPSLIRAFSKYEDAYVTKYYTDAIREPALYIEINDEQELSDWLSDTFSIYAIKNSPVPSFKVNKGGSLFNLSYTIKDILMGMSLFPVFLGRSDRHFPKVNISNSVSFYIMINCKESLYSMRIKVFLRKKVSCDLSEVSDNDDDLNNYFYIKERLNFLNNYSRSVDFYIDLESPEWYCNHLNMKVLNEDCYKDKYAFFTIGLGDLIPFDSSSISSTSKNESPLMYLSQYSALKKNLMRRYMELLNNTEPEFSESDDSINNESWEELEFINEEEITKIICSENIESSYLPSYPEICLEQVECADKLMSSINKYCKF